MSFVRPHRQCGGRWFINAAVASYHQPVMLSACHGLAQVGITIEAVEREILGWDYYSVISGEATREGIADAGRVPITFDSLSAYSKVGIMQPRLGLPPHCCMMRLLSKVIVRF